MVILSWRRRICAQDEVTPLNQILRFAHDERADNTYDVQIFTHQVSENEAKSPVVHRKMNGDIIKAPAR
jgi:hypothetical protein